MVKVLVVEDEASIREMIALNLRRAGMEAVEADSAEAALPLLEQRPGCDAAILDVMLPGMNGFSLCETIRRTDQKIGIIILSAKGQEQDKIRGLSIGADDYMTKPFSVSELLARVEALCRRVNRSTGGENGKEAAPAALVSGDFVLDENRRVLLKAGRPIELTQVEFQIMELFFHSPAALIICQNLWRNIYLVFWEMEQQLSSAARIPLRMQLLSNANSSDIRFLMMSALSDLMFCQSLLIHHLH